MIKLLKRDFIIGGLITIIGIMTIMDVTPNEFYFLVSKTLPNYLKYKLFKIMLDLYSSLLVYLVVISNNKRKNKWNQ